MSISFSKARDLVLLTLLDRLRHEDNQHWFSAIEIKHHCVALSGTLAARAAEALVREDLVQRTIEDGEIGYNLSDEGIEVAEQIESRDGMLRDLVPAADRIVSINHNQPEWLVIEKAAEALSQQLAKGNDLGTLTREEASVAKGEVEEIKHLIALPNVRFSVVRDRTGATLRWIGGKAAGAAVGKAALALLALIAAFFGF